MIPKPEPRAKEKARKKRQADAARAACVKAVWARAEHRCESCGKYVREPFGGWARFFGEIGHVHERVSRARGGDPTDPSNCLLLCFDCHFSGPSGAHRKSE